MLKSKIICEGGAPRLYVEGEPTTAIAYTTYFEERSAYKDFIKSGYRIFFVNVSMTKLPINSHTSGFTPFRVGVFEDPSRPDYSEFEDAVRKIIKECPTAIIFPRIYVSMPSWWIGEHPDEVIPTPKGGIREILFSDVFRKDAKELLISLVRHIKESDYAHRVGGWQICGGLTQEWFHHDRNGSLGKPSEKYYKRWLKESFGTECGALPSPDEYKYRGEAYQSSENARMYSIFSNTEVAKTLDYFAEVLKEETEREQIVGAFYGYAFQSNGSTLFGTHGLRCIIDSQNIDFLSSPNAYTDNRPFGIDWADMMPVDSIKKHGKLCFIECDIRTYLTKAIQDVRPGEYPEDMYKTGKNTSVWYGPPTPKLSVFALRKSFAHQLTKSSAIWWFDMWGGWYDDPLLMESITSMKAIYDGETGKKHKNTHPRVAFFADESGYANLYDLSDEIFGIERTRTNATSAGVPLDFLLVEDLEVLREGYDAAIFPFPIPSEAGKKAIDLCCELGIPVLCATAEHFILTENEIRDFLTENGVHIYCEQGNVIYVGEGYVALHSSVGGTKTIKLPKPQGVRAVFGTEFENAVTDRICFDLEENGTALFAFTEDD